MFGPISALAQVRVLPQSAESPGPGESEEPSISSLLGRKSKPFRASTVSGSSLRSSEEEEVEGDTFFLTICWTERKQEEERVPTNESAN